MKVPLPRLAARAGLAGFLALGIGCYPVYPPGSAYAPGYSQDAKGYDVPYGEPAHPQQAPPPARYGVDPGLAIAGAAAIGLLGYAIGSNHHHGYYAPGPYYYGRGYYGPRCY